MIGPAERGFEALHEAGRQRQMTQDEHPLDGLEGPDGDPADRDVVGHYSRLPLPRRSGVRLVAVVNAHRPSREERHMTEPSFLDALAHPQKR